MRIDGSSVYGQSELRLLYERFIGQEITLATVFAIASDVTRKYANDGYALSIGFVPAQEIEDGDVWLMIAEGYVSDVEIRGSGRYPARLLDLYTAKIMQSRPLRTSVLERYLLLANDLSGLNVHGTFERGDIATGATRLILDADQKAINIGLSYNNRGSRALGRPRIGMSIGLNSLLRGGGQISVKRIAAEDTDELIYYAYNASVPLGSEGTLLSLNVTQTDSEPGTDLLRTLEFASDGTTATLALTNNWIRSRTQNLSSRLAFDYKDLESDILALTNSEDKLRVLRASASWDFLDRLNGITWMGATVSKGIDILDATPNSSPTKSRSDGVFDFTSTQIDFLRVQKMGTRVDVVTEVSGQYSFQNLLSSEQCGYGGGHFGRGYDNYELAGDHCLKGAIEFQIKLKARFEEITGARLYAFLDAGKVWQRGVVLPGELKDETAKSAGFGLRMTVAEKLTGFVEFSKPLNHEVALEGNDDGRVFFSFNGRF